MHGSESFTKLFIQMQLHALAHSVGIEESYPRIASYQLHRSNTPAANASQYYQRTLTICSIIETLIRIIHTAHAY